MRRTLISLAGLATLSTVVIGCGSDDDASASGDCEPTSTVEVVGTDALQFAEDAYSGESPCVELVYRNDGSIAHTLLVRGESGFKLSIGTEDRGTIELEPGTYELYCDVAGHESAGMVAPLEVA
jgi:plastocyanin